MPENNVSPEVARVAKLMDDGDLSWTRERPVLIDAASVWRDVRDMRARTSARNARPDLA